MPTPPHPSAPNPSGPNPSPPNPPDPASPHRGNGPVYGWGLVGASRAAQRHLIPALLGLHQPLGSPAWKRARIIGLYSSSRSRGNDFAAANRLSRVYNQPADLLGREDVDCVYVSSQPRHQYAHALAALEAGKHLLCETPTALSLAEVTALERTAGEQGLLFVPNYAYRGDAALARMAEMARDYAIGELLGAQIINCTPLAPELQTWRLAAEGGGVVLDRTLHDIDLVRWLFADEIEQVAALAAPRVLGRHVDEEVVVNLRMRRSGQLVQCHDSFVTPHRFSSVELYGSRGSLRVHHWWSRRRPSELLLVRNDEVEVIPVDGPDHYTATVNAFHQTLDGWNRGEALSGFLASSRDGVHNLRAALAVMESLRNGWSVRVE